MLSEILSRMINEGCIEFKPDINGDHLFGYSVIPTPGREKPIRSKSMYEISKTFKFSAAHALTRLPETHKCHRMHGHNYTVTVFLRAKTLSDCKFVRDYGELDEVKKWLDNKFDHRNLNEVLMTEFTTAEFLAHLMYDQFRAIIPELYKVTVQETDSTTASYWEE